MRETATGTLAGGFDPDDMPCCGHLDGIGSTGAVSLFTSVDFLNYRLCAGYAWLTRYRPDIVPDVSDPSSRRREAADADVRLLAQQLTPGAVVIPQEDAAQAIALTVAAMEAGADVIHGATVASGRDLVATADTLVRHEGRWIYRLVRASTSVKNEHVQEAAFGVRVFAEAGIEIVDVQLHLLNKQYRRNSELDVSALLVLEDLSAKVGRVLAHTARDMDAAVSVLSDPHHQAMCRCDLGTRGQRCPTFAMFHPGIGSGNTVYDLGGISGRKLDLVLARGITRLADWPADIDVTERQRQQIDAVRHGRSLVDGPRLQGFLAQLQFPLYFLDYETFQTAVPLYEGCYPWAQIPFQYSVHVQSAEGEVSHREFLWTDGSQSPVGALVQQLRHDVGPSGSVVVWNKGFERTRNQEMADMVPEAAEFLHGINQRMVDLMDVVKDGMWVHPAFNGSASIKKVLPVAAPELSYDALDIGEGMAAAERWVQATLRERDELSVEEQDAIFAALRVYCHQDTLAMIRVLSHVQSLVATEASAGS